MAPRALLLSAAMLAACAGTPSPEDEPEPGGTDGGRGRADARLSPMTRSDAPAAADARPASGDMRASSGDGRNPVNPDHPPGQPGGLPSTAEVFADDVVHTYSLIIAASDLAMMPRLAKNPATENTYVPAMAVIDGVDLGKVGVRYKCAYGTLQSCIDSTFKVTCPKLSLKVKVDEYDLEKRWKGIKKVNLHAMNVDPTKMREHLGYKLYRDMGIVAPRAAHAKVTINGQVKGLYALTEAPDGRMTADRFAPMGDGNLYKEIWPTSTDPNRYHAKLETNEDKRPMHEQFVAFARELRDATTPVDRAKVVEKWAGLEYLLRYTAVDRIISNWDGITAFYCGTTPPGTSCGNHNYYWYLDEAKTRFYLVAWDLDNSWLLHHQLETMLPSWRVKPADCSMRGLFGRNLMMPPGCDPLFQGLQGAGTAAWEKALQALLDGPFDVAKLHADIERRAKVMADTVAADPTMNAAGWRGQVDKFKADIVLLREKLQLMRDGKDPSPFSLRTDGINDFEGVAKVSYAMGVSTDPNPASLAVRALNETAPLAGMSDARVDFTYRTSTTAYTWLNWRMAMRGGTANLTSVKRLRLKIKADSMRGVRIELDSGKYKNPSSGARFGWGITATTAPQTITLELDKLAMPSWAPAGSGDVLADIRAAATGLMVGVDSKGLNSMGFFPPGGSDTGWVQIDDIEFLAN